MVSLSFLYTFAIPKEAFFNLIKKGKRELGWWWWSQHLGTAQPLMSTNWRNHVLTWEIQQWRDCPSIESSDLGWSLFLTTAAKTINAGNAFGMPSPLSATETPGHREPRAERSPHVQIEPSYFRPPLPHRAESPPQAPAGLEYQAYIRMTSAQIVKPETKPSFHSS